MGPSLEALVEVARSAIRLSEEEDAGEHGIASLAENVHWLADDARRALGVEEPEPAADDPEDVAAVQHGNATREAEALRLKRDFPR